MSDYVSDDLINEIFERLPVKSLLRFRSLSKSFCSRIQSPDFILRHVLRSREKTPKIFIRHSLWDRDSSDMYTIHSEDQFVSSNPEWLDVSIPAMKVPDSIGNRLIGEIVGSCNGVLCMFHHNKNTISLWNPSIRHVIILPSSPNNHYLASLVGFGFDPSIDDYKIVRISQKRSFVYTLKRQVWCPIASPTTVVLGRGGMICPCFFNGALHWVVTECYYQSSKYILTFNVTTHVFGKITLPNPCWEISELTIINNSLAVIPVTRRYQHPYGENNRIWILNYYNNVPSWSGYEFGQLGVKPCLQLTTNNHILVEFNDANRFYNRTTYGVYNPGTGKWDPSMIMYFQDSWPRHMKTYVESLELLDIKLGKKKMYKMKKMNKTDETARHNVTLRKSKCPISILIN